MEVQERLREARELVRKGWTQKAPARTSYGTSCWVNSPLATSYCTAGAASCVTWETPIHEDGSPFTQVLDALTGALADLWDLEKEEWAPPWDAVEMLTKWNDSPGRSQNEVLRLYDRAIELVEA